MILFVRTMYVKKVEHTHKHHGVLFFFKLNK
jgi:hypothetical protein